MSNKTEHAKNPHKSRATAAPAGKKHSGKSTWKMMDRAATIAAGLIAHRVSCLTWRAATGKKPPTSTRHPDVGNAEAITWAVVAGAGVELTKVLIRRGMANYWVRSTGRLPPGMKPLKTAEKRTDKEKPADPPQEASAGTVARRGAVHSGKRRRRFSSRSRGT